MLLNNENWPADAPSVQPGCVCAEGTLHGLELSISIIVSRLLVHRFDNVTACTVHCILSNGSVATSAEVTGLHEGAEAGVSRVRALCGCRKSVGPRRGAPGLGERHLKWCKDCPSAAFEGFDPSMRSICQRPSPVKVRGPSLQFSHIFYPTVTKTHDRN